MKVQRDRFFEMAHGREIETHHVSVSVIMSTDRSETSAMMNTLPLAKQSQIDEILTRALDAVVDVLDETQRRGYIRRAGCDVESTI